MSMEYKLPKEAQILIKYLEEEECSQATVQAYTQDVYYLFEYTKKSPLEITRQDIKNFLKDRCKTAGTFNRRKASITRMFNIMVIEKMIKENPAIELGIRREPEKQIKYLTTDEMSKMNELASDKARDSAIVSVLLNCGLRSHELLGLDLMSIKNGCLHVIGKGGKPRSVPVPASTQTTINEYLKVRKAKRNEMALFTNKDGGRLGRTSLTKTTKKYFKQLGHADFSNHTCRHSTASAYAMNGADIITIGEILGHSNPATSKIYIHIAESRLKEKSIDFLK